jgi:hypothetical protein
MVYVREDYENDEQLKEILKNIGTENNSDEEYLDNLVADIMNELRNTFREHLAVALAKTWSECSKMILGESDWISEEAFYPDAEDAGFIHMLLNYYS